MTSIHLELTKISSNNQVFKSKLSHGIQKIDDKNKNDSFISTENQETSYTTPLVFLPSPNGTSTESEITVCTFSNVYFKLPFNWLKKV